MPEVELQKFPSKESGANLQDKGDLQTACPSKRRGCALVNTPTPCVNKALCHIQELKRKLENWDRQAADPDYQNSEIQNYRTNIFRHADPAIPTELYIEGMGICIQENGGMSPLWKETAYVLEEVTCLIARLETNRQEAEEALLKEKNKARKLMKKMDLLSLWKQQEFPVAVQKEHEACTRDISELKWHLKMRRDQLQRVRDGLSHTEVLNQRLNQDIDFVRKHSPLVQEKLQLESEIMNHIKNAQNEANVILSDTSTKLRCCQETLKLEELSTNKEKELMDMDLKDTGNQQKELINQLKQLQSYGDVCCGKVDDIKEMIALNEEQCSDMHEQIPLLRKQESEADDSVEGLKAKIKDKIMKIEEKMKQISELQTLIQAARHAGEAKLSEFEEELNKKRQEFWNLHNENKDMELEIEDYDKKICESVEAVNQLQKDKKHVLLRISQNVEQREQATGELTHMADLHAKTRDKLEDLEQQTLTKEQRMRTAQENLRKQTMAEMKALAILKGKVASSTVEYVQLRGHCERAERELQHECEEASLATAQLEAELAELCRIHTEKSETIENLKGKLHDIRSAHKISSKDMGEKKKRCLDHFNGVKELHNAVVTTLQETLNRIQELSVKSEDYCEASDMMEKTAAAMPNIIDELQGVFDALEFKHNSAAVMMNSLLSDTSNCKKRTAQSMESHVALLTDRQRTMEETKAKLKKAMKENGDLAYEYRELQNALMVAKQEAVCVFNEKNRAEASFLDHKQLSLLQKRMHKAMVKYFSHRSVYSQAELAHFQALSNESSQKMNALQEELSKAIQRISEFLRSLTDDSTSSAATAANKQSPWNANGSTRNTAAAQTAE